MKRFEPCREVECGSQGVCESINMIHTKNGHYVLYSDAKVIEEERDRLKEERDKLQDFKDRFRNGCNNESECCPYYCMNKKAESDLAAVYRKIWEAGKWEEFEHGMKDWWHRENRPDDFTAWLFCLDPSQIPERLAMVAEWIGKEKG